MALNPENNVWIAIYKEKYGLLRKIQKILDQAYDQGPISFTGIRIKDLPFTQEDMDARNTIFRELY